MHINESHVNNGMVNGVCARMRKVQIACGRKFVKRKKKKRKIRFFFFVTLKNIGAEVCEPVFNNSNTMRRPVCDLTVRCKKNGNFDSKLPSPSSASVRASLTNGSASARKTNSVKVGTTRVINTQKKKKKKILKFRFIYLFILHTNASHNHPQIRCLQHSCHC
jgi:hypothetical protein